jgi:hypothetical protein
MRTVLGIWGFFTLGLVACVGEAPIVGSSENQKVGTDPSDEPPVSIRYVVAVLAHHEAPSSSCLSRRLAVDASGRSTCKLVAVSATPEGATVEDVACRCEERGLGLPSPAASAVVLAEMEKLGMCESEPSLGLPACSAVCTCEVPQAQGESWRECEYESMPSSQSVGYCYIEPARGIGSQALVQGCFEPAARVRALGGVLAENQPYFALCHDESSGSAVPVEDPAPVGSPCVPPDENVSGFSGYDELEVSVFTGVDACASGTCVANHFRGRASCPYGQTAAQAQNDPRCFLPGSDVAVTTLVQPQLVDRSGEKVVTCSCRCDGLGPGNYCDCPGGTQCLPLVEPLGLPDDDAIAGSYCVPIGTAFSLQSLGTAECMSEFQNCGDARPY